ncbi:MAG: hypothetical protein H0T46_11800 [Deltaproteobacteria bacterium]|nr:hypothetical protein [Deltaproteobacteria bacterium]
MADDAGALLVRSGLITPNALADARARMETSGGTIGEQLVVMAAIGDEALTDFYRSRLLVPQVNPNTLARLPIKVVAAIPSDMAIELRAIPVALDGENNLTVAMSDPADRNAVDEITWFTGAYVVRAVATQMQIAWCLAHYYGHVTQLGQKLMQSTGASAPISPPVARTKGVTGKVEALRHKRIPASGQAINLERPRSGEIVVAPLGVNDSTPRIERPVEPPPRAVSQPAAIDSDGVPDKPRARSISGEIRVPGRRAPSIRPPMPEPATEMDESGPVMTIEVSDQEEETAPQKMMPVRRRKAKTDPPELAARAGEVELHTGPIRKVDLEEPRIIVQDLEENTHPTMAVTVTSGEMSALDRPEPSSAAPSSTIEVSDETSASVTITEQPYRDFDSQPILLERRRPSDQPTNVAVARAPSADEGDGDGDVVVLEAKKPKNPRPAKQTQVGIGALPAATRPHRDTDAGGVPDAFDDAVTGSERLAGDDATVVTLPAPARDDISDERLVAPPSPDDTDSGLAAPPSPDDDDNDNTIPPPVARKPGDKAAAKHIDYDPVDDGWGPPGTTIPPPLLGAVPGTHDESESARIPVSNVDSAPLIIAPATPPQAQKSDAVQTPARALEEATSRLIELIRTLEHTHNRDEVVGIMVQHLGETHQRAGFLAIKRDELTVFSIHPKRHTMPYASIRLDRPSTLADVVTTRLPYRGPVPDEPSKHFLTAVLAASPPEILLVPVAVRERVVGVLFAENRSRHTFDDQLAYASRAAGMALERILKAKRS